MAAFLPEANILFTLTLFLYESLNFLMAKFLFAHVCVCSLQYVLILYHLLLLSFQPYAPLPKTFLLNY